MKKKKIRLLLVDDHFFVRMGLAVSLNAEPDLQVVADAADGSKALKLYREHRPDVVLMDGRLPGMSGTETLSALRREFPEVQVLMISVDEGEEDVYRAMQAGAAGYLPKAALPEELLRAIRTIHAGDHYLPPTLVARLAQRAPGATLTARELEVLELIAKGMSNFEIAKLLDCAKVTVKWHSKHILQKLEVTNRAEAMRVAIERGILHIS